MVKNCSALTCQNRIDNCNRPLHFHRIPAEPTMKSKWLAACGRGGWDPGRHTYICSDHFPPECYRVIQPDLRRPRLVEGAVPSLFVTSSPPNIQHVNLRKSCFKEATEVEFKPEMWDDKSKSKNKQEIVKKRGRGRPRKTPKINNENTSVNGNNLNDNKSSLGVNGNVSVSGSGTCINGSSEMFSESVPCCALACPNTSDTHVMNHLPEEPSQRQVWVQNLDRLAWTPDPDSALCEIHFEQDMWDYNVGGEKSLKHDAVPTLFLHGEAIQSWVTLGNSGKVKIVNNCESGDENMPESEWDEGDNEDVDEQDIIVKHEALEPEIDMVEGSEEVVSKDTRVDRNPFETIFCDVTHPDAQQDLAMEPKKIKLEQDNNDTAEIGELENPLSPEIVYIDDQSESTQSGSDNKEEGNLNINIFNVKSLQDEEYEKSNLRMIARAEYIEKWKIRRRSSAQLTDKYQCHICERKLSRKKNLEVHIQKLHPNGELTESQKRNKTHQVEVNAKLKNLQQEKQQCLPENANPSTPHTQSQAVDPLGEALVIPTVSEEDSHSPITIVTSPRPLDPSPAGGEMKKQFLVFIPTPQHEKILPPIEGPSFSLNLTNDPAEKEISPPDESPTFSLRLVNVPVEKKISTAIGGPTFSVNPANVPAEKKISPPIEGSSFSVNLTNVPTEKKIPPVEGPSFSVNLANISAEKKILPPVEGSSFSVNLTNVPAEKRLALRIKLKELVDAVVHKNLDPERIIIAYDRT